MKVFAEALETESSRIGTVTATWEDDWVTGTTLYTVTASRVTGVLSITLQGPRPYNDEPRPLDPWTQQLRVEPGRPVAGGYLQRAEPLTVNGIALAGVSVVEVGEIAERPLRGDRMHVLRDHGRSYLHTRDVPERTCDRYAAVVEVLAQHWVTRPVTTGLRFAAAQHHARPHAAFLRKRAGELGAEAYALHRKSVEFAARAEQAAAVLALAPAQPG